MDTQTLEVLKGLQTAQAGILDRLERTEKTPASSPTAVELHGVGSLFGSHSIEREVVTAHMRPFGLGALLPKIATTFEQPFFSAITGVTATSGSEPTEPCDDNPRAWLKACDLTAQFGRVARDTGTIEIDKVMLKKNRGDFTDLQLYGELLGMSGFTVTGMTSDQILNVVTKAEMVIASIALERELSQHLWQGSIFNNAGAYKEMPGLMYQIATGQMDAHTGTLCPALDSDVKNFGYQNVEDQNSLRDIVTWLGAMEAYLHFNADNMGLTPVTYALCMRAELWFILSAIYPCAYHTNKCSSMDTSGVDPVPYVDSADMVGIRDAMREGMWIDINGRRYTVVLDSGIHEEDSTNSANVEPGFYASSIFFVPLTAAGMRATYMEHIDYRAASPDVSLMRGLAPFWTDGGMYYWAMEDEKWCIKLSVKAEMRVILRMPHLAGRIDDIMYRPTQHFRSVYPDDPYFADGGVSMRPDETTFHVW